jgi:D-amino-acid dehydrogenase
VRVIVVGGGAVGLCVAEALAHRGGECILLERDRCGAGASAGNAGWITPSLAIPIPAPGVIRESLRWLLDRSGPLWIHPALSPAMFAWLARFIASCSRPAYLRHLASLQRAAALAGPSFERLVDRGLQFEMHDDPLLYPAFGDAELGHLWQVASELREAGATQSLERLSAGDVLSLEPALDRSVVGGVIARGEGRVRPELFTAALARALASHAAEVHEHTPVTSLFRDGEGWLVQTPAGPRRADAIVLANGVEAVLLLRPLGVRMPILAAKGYSRTYAPGPSGPRRALYLEQPKVAISVFDGGVRVSGTLELGARDLALSSRRLAAITAVAQRAMPRWQMPPQPRDWAGMRSLSPDGLPLIGNVPGLPGMHLATGHGTLGITLAPATGELLAELLLERKRDPLLDAFDPGRFATKRLGRTVKLTTGGVP